MKLIDVMAMTVVVLVLLFVMFGCGSPEEVVTAKIEQEVYEKKITFILPIEYTATVAQCNPKCSVRYYSPRAK